MAAIGCTPENNCRNGVYVKPQQRDKGLTRNCSWVGTWEFSIFSPYTVITNSTNAATFMVRRSLHCLRIFKNSLPLYFEITTFEGFDTNIRIFNSPLHFCMFETLSKPGLRRHHKPERRSERQLIKFKFCRWINIIIETLCFSTVSFGHSQQCSELHKQPL